MLNFIQDIEEVSSRHLTKDVKRRLDRALKDFETLNLVIKKITDPQVPINGKNSLKINSKIIFTIRRYSPKWLCCIVILIFFIVGVLNINSLIDDKLSLKDSLRQQKVRFSKTAYESLLSSDLRFHGIQKVLFSI